MQGPFSLLHDTLNTILLFKEYLEKHNLPIFMEFNELFT